MLRSSFILLLTLVGCAQTTEKDVLEIRSVMDLQVEAWNQGDIPGYMQGYWNSDQLVFTGGKSKTMGWQDALDRYERSYGSKETMGELAFDDLEIQVTDPTSAFATGAWTLNRTQDTLSGRFTLVWRKLHGDWVIVADHSS